MPTILPIKELRNTNEISERCHEKDEPIFVTKNGYGDLVVMRIETYEAMIGNEEIDSAIAASEAEIDNGGELIDARAALNKLRKKYLE